MGDSFDYIVIGAGPAGSAVACRLADAPDAPRVALVETGPARSGLLSDMPLGLAALVGMRNRSNYAYETVAQSGLGGRKGFQPRGRGLGGSSRINAMICIRGQKEDYDEWAKAGCTGWGWDDVLPLFRRLETNERGSSLYHGDKGPLPVSDLRHPSPASEAFISSAEALRFPRNEDFNGGRQEGVGFFQVFQRNGRRVNAGAAYVGMRERANLTVLTDTIARKIEIVSNRATSVVVGRRGAQRVLTARREIIVSGGAFGSPQILMLSGIGPGDVLQRYGIPVVRDMPSVGRNLQDHLDYTTNVVAKAPGLLTFGLPAAMRAVLGYRSWSRNGLGMLTTNVAEAGGFVRSSPDVERPDLQFHFCISLVDDHGRKFSAAGGYAIHVCVLRPKSRGHVELGSADPEKSLLIDPGFLSEPEDLELLLKGAKLARRIMATPPLSDIGGKLLHGAGLETDEELAQLIRSKADTIYHPVGTCRMGNDEQSVVDPQLRVRGVSCLRVADASIMPTLISGNTQAPSAMIGEKAADLILGRG